MHIYASLVDVILSFYSDIRWICHFQLQLNLNYIDLCAIILTCAHNHHQQVLSARIATVVYPGDCVSHKNAVNYHFIDERL